MARTMIGAEEVTVQPARSGVAGTTKLELTGIRALDDAGVIAVNDVSLAVRAGEIVGIAGVSGNGQRQLVEVLAGATAGRERRGPGRRPLPITPAARICAVTRCRCCRKSR